MSKGNLKDQGNQGKNFPYQLRNLQLLSFIAGNTSGLVPVGGLATEATQLNVLAALQNQQEFVSTLVKDLGGVGCPGNCPVYNKVMIYDEGTGTWTTTYYNAAGAVVVPIGPLEYINPQYTLEQILVEVTSSDAHLATIAAAVVGTHMQCDVLTLPAVTQGTSPWVVSSTDLATIAGAVSGGGMNVNLQSGTGTDISSTGSYLDVKVQGTVEVNLDATDDQVGIYGYDGATPTRVTVDAAGHLQVDVLTMPTVTIQDGGNSITVDAVNLDIRDLTFASDKVDASGSSVKLQDGSGNAITSTSNALDVNVKSTTPTTNVAMSLTRATGAGTVAAGKRSISVANVGSAAGSILGGVGNILQGEQVTFTANGVNDTLASMAYDGTGTTLLITTVG